MDSVMKRIEERCKRGHEEIDRAPEFTFKPMVRKKRRDTSAPKKPKSNSMGDM